MRKTTLMLMTTGITLIMVFSVFGLSNAQNRSVAPVSAATTSAVAEKKAKSDFDRSLYTEQSKMQGLNELRAKALMLVDEYEKIADRNANSTRIQQLTNEMQTLKANMQPYLEREHGINQSPERKARPSREELRERGRVDNSQTVMPATTSSTYELDVKKHELLTIKEDMSMAERKGSLSEEERKVYQTKISTFEEEIRELTKTKFPDKGKD